MFLEGFPPLFQREAPTMHVAATAQEGFRMRRFEDVA
jgi:hypothetical protein